MTHRHFSSRPIDRRSFLAGSVSCGAYVASLAAFSPLMTGRVFGRTDDREVVAEESWGRLEKIDDGIWALISTPFDTRDFTTVCNGGIIAGDDGVLVVEAYMSADGAKWMAESAEKLTGRWPTHVAVSHYHGDHSAGNAGFEKDSKRPQILTTAKTAELVKQSRASNPDAEPELTHVESVSADKATTIDLGGRSVTFHPRAGHTASDMTLEISEPSVMWCGDLVFNGLVPNYRDSQPKMLSTEVGKMIDARFDAYVPGHGPIASLADMEAFAEFLKDMGEGVRKLHADGVSVEDAGTKFEMPQKYKDWVIFSPQVIPAMAAAWYREFAAE